VHPRTKKIALSLLVGLLAISAGCSAIQSTDDTSTRLLIANQDNTDHAVLVEITQNEDVVYSAGRTIEAESNAELAQFDQTGEYEVKITVDGNSTVQTYDFTAEDSTTTVGVDNNGNATIGT